VPQTTYSRTQFWHLSGRFTAHLALYAAQTCSWAIASWEQREIFLAFGFLKYVNSVMLRRSVLSDGNVELFFVVSGWNVLGRFPNIVDIFSILFGSLWWEHGIIPLIPFLFGCILILDCHLILCSHSFFPLLKHEYSMLELLLHLFHLDLSITNIGLSIHHLFLDPIHLSYLDSKLFFPILMVESHLLNTVVQINQAFIELL